jgi:hypothetical protein
MCRKHDTKTMIFHLVLSLIIAVDVSQKESRNDSPPVISSHLTSATVTDGDAVTLQCQIIGKLMRKQ